MTKNKTVGYIGYWLVVIGAVNWGLVGIGHFVGGNWNVVNLLLGSWPAVEAIVYILVGLSAALMVFGCRCGRHTCKTSEAGEQM
ncbi:DUF378 domain-containing protein [Patescibacteria group bacterium]